MASEILFEEFEVLESIYPTELTKLSDDKIQIEVEPDDLFEGEKTVKLVLIVRYPEGYPDILPEFRLEPSEGEFEEEEITKLLDDLRVAGAENLGMAMTFTLVSLLREQLSNLVKDRAEKQRLEEREKERLALEAEEARTRGTPVTRESFLAWKAKFDKEMNQKKAREDEERIRAFTAKEKEEWKRIGTRPSGRQLFEKNKNLEDESLLEEGTVSVDISQYERNEDDAEEENEKVTFSDSD